MKVIYKKLMEQNGGSIPFTLLGGVHHNKHKNKTIRRPKKKVSKTRRRQKPLSTKGYSVGTIIRHKGQLMKLNTSRKWTNV
tara:strand:+ start:495 stop:737 length:243 start_codon:yes stop_codon:yes gene_type:complete